MEGQIVIERILCTPVQYVMPFHLNVLNATDEEYAERADWTTFNGDRYFPGEPVRAFFGVTWKYK